MTIDLHISFSYFYSSNQDQKDKDEQAKIANLPPTKVYCMRCPKKHAASDDLSDTPMILEAISEGSVVISNANLELVFDEDTRLLASIRDKKSNVTKNVKMVFGGYATMQFRNGAYLFKQDSYRTAPLPVIDPVDNLKEIIIISGHVFSEISLIYEAGSSVTIQGNYD